MQSGIKRQESEIAWTASLGVLVGFFVFVYFWGFFK